MAQATAPFAFTQPPTQIRATNATLNGMTVPNGELTKAWFEWGVRGGYGQTTAPLSIGTGTAVVPVSATITALTRGGYYQCRLVSSNASGVRYGAVQVFTTGRKVSAWGANWAGQTNFPAGLSNTVVVAAGDMHAMALKADGTLTTWGYDGGGKLDVPANVTNAIAMVCGEGCSLALNAASTVTGWGDGYYGEADVPAGLTNVIAIAGAWYHCLALKSNGTVVGWGNNNYGQTNVPPELTNVVAVAAGYGFSLALKAGGTPVAWGFYYDGQTNVPPHLTNVVAVAAGISHAAALKADGTVEVWGANSHGQRDVPADLTNVVMLAAGGHHTLALKADGSVVGWGDTGNGYGEATLPPGISNVIAVSAGYGLSLVIQPNLPPQAFPQRVAAVANRDSIITLAGKDPDKDPLSFKITSLPANGSLYQCVNGARGTAINSPNTVVSNAAGQVIFAPAAGGYGNPYTTFGFVANDGEALSAPATVTLVVGLSYTFTHAATKIRPTTATLNGMATPNGLATMAWFEWGARGGFGQTTTPVSVGTGSWVVPVNASITALTNGGFYQSRLVVSNACGVRYGAPQLFTTGRKVSAWGDNVFGQTNFPAGLTNAVLVAACPYHAMGLKADGTLLAWGHNDGDKAIVPANLTNAVAVAGGYAYSLALKSNGALTAWGYGAYGETSPPADLTNIIAIAGGWYHCLALRSNGTVVAWGSNENGLTNVPPGLTNAVAVAAGATFSLALKADGTPVAWGTGDYPVTNVPPHLTNVVAIAAGSMHAVVLKTDGTIEAWGNNSYGQTDVPADLTNVVMITAGGEHNLALKMDGSVVGWGATGYTYGEATLPPGISNVIAVSAGYYFSLAIHPNLPPTAIPQRVTAVANRDKVIALAGTDPDKDLLSYKITSLPAKGSLYQCVNGVRGAAITSPNTVVSNAAAQVVYAPVAGGYGNPYTTFTFVANDGEVLSTAATVTIVVGLPYTFTQAATKIRPTTATLNGMATPNGLATSVWFEWGVRGGFGQTAGLMAVGNGAGVVRASADITNLQSAGQYQCRLVVSNVAGVVYGATELFATGMKIRGWGGSNYGQTNVPAGLTRAVSIASGGNHCLALQADGSVVVWGDNSQNQTNVPANLSNVVAVSGCGNHSLALKADGTVVPWGSNYGYQNTVPSFVTNVIAIADGHAHCLALRADGTLVAWGETAAGVTNIPPGLSNVVAVSAGASHNAVLQADGTVVAWGYNGYTDAETNVPPGLSGVVALANGGYHCLALKSDGTIAAWGYGGFGQTTVPVGLSNVISVAAGPYHSLALKSDGFITGWGMNWQGQTSVPPIVNNALAIAGGYEHSLALVPNPAPTASSQVVTAQANREVVITLAGTDPDGDWLAFRIASLPAVGALYQYTNGARGAAIVAPNIAVADASGRIIFAPATNGVGSPHATFTFVASDGGSESSPATVTVNVCLPPAPQLSNWQLTSNRVFELYFTGGTNGSYRVWASTNLQTWEPLGLPEETMAGSFRFLDFSTTNWPCRFYRAGAP